MAELRMDLFNLKRNQLQRLAKKAGLKANLKNTELVQSLQHNLNNGLPDFSNLENSEVANDSNPGSLVLSEVDEPVTPVCQLFPVDSFNLPFLPVKCPRKKGFSRKTHDRESKRRKYLKAISPTGATVAIHSGSSSSNSSRGCSGTSSLNTSFSSGSCTSESSASSSPTSLSKFSHVDYISRCSNLLNMWCPDERYQVENRNRPSGVRRLVFTNSDDANFGNNCPPSDQSEPKSLRRSSRINTKNDPSSVLPYGFFLRDFLLSQLQKKTNKERKKCDTSNMEWLLKELHEMFERIDYKHEFDACCHRLNLIVQNDNSNKPETKNKKRTNKKSKKSPLTKSSNATIAKNKDTSSKKQKSDLKKRTKNHPPTTPSR